MKLVTAKDRTQTFARDPIHPEHAHTVQAQVNPFRGTHVDGEVMARTFGRATVIHRTFPHFDSRKEIGQ